MSEHQILNAYFSPTGTTYQVAKAIAEGTGCPVSDMDLSVPDCSGAVQAQTVVLASAPVYGGRIPSVALERLSRLQGNGQKAVAIAVYGNREFDDALQELKSALTACGFQVVAAAAFIAEHSIVRSIAAGRPDENDRAIAQRFGAELITKLDTLTEVTVPGNVPTSATKSSPFHPNASEDCTQCGLCATQCPVAAIPIEDPARTLDDICINCMRCVKICPVQARALPAPFLEGAAKMLSEKAAGYKQPQLFGL